MLKGLAFALSLATTGCATTHYERPGDEFLLHVKTERRTFMWSGWDFQIHTQRAWYTDGIYTAIPVSDILTITGDWYDPEKAAQRETLEVVASTGVLFPPNFLFMAGLWPDKRCRGELRSGLEPKKKYDITSSELSGEVTLRIWSVETGQVLASTICQPL